MDKERNVSTLGGSLDSRLWTITRTFQSTANSQGKQRTEETKISHETERESEVYTLVLQPHKKYIISVTVQAIRASHTPHSPAHNARGTHITHRATAQSSPAQEPAWQLSEGDGRKLRAPAAPAP